MQRRDDVGLPPAKLQIEMCAELPCLVREEHECLVERREVRAELSEALERPVADGSLVGTVAHLVEIVRVGDDELASLELEDVELDEIDPGGERGPKRDQGVLGRESRRSAMPDPERASVAALERDHGSGLVGR
jgi:hypothetical protein